MFGTSGRKRTVSSSTSVTRPNTRRPFLSARTTSSARMSERRMAGGRLPGGPDDLHELVQGRAPPGGAYPRRARVRTVYATSRSQEGHQACPSIRAHQGQREGAGRLGGPRGGDRRAHREQGARAVRRVAPAVADLDAGHEPEPARRAALRDEPAE